MLHYVTALMSSILIPLSLHMLFFLTKIPLPSVKRKKELIVAKLSSKVEYRVVDFTIAKVASILNSIVLVWC